MDRVLLLLLLQLLSLVTLHAIAVAPVAMARPLGVGSAEPPSTATGVVAATNGTAVASAPSAQGTDGGHPDRSIAGAEVILGGFATAVFAIIFCYIRVTRRHAADADA